MCSSDLLFLINNYDLKLINCIVRFVRDGAARITYELITGCSRPAFDSAAIISVGRHGELTTGALSGTAAVLLTVHEEYGINQTAVVHVEVCILFRIISKFSVSA